jgi:hypothetical protein
MMIAGVVEGGGTFFIFCREWELFPFRLSLLPVVAYGAKCCVG